MMNDKIIVLIRQRRSYLTLVDPITKAVQTESRKAFRKLPNVEQAMATLTNLKGVGTTLASGDCPAPQCACVQKYFPF